MEHPGPWGFSDIVQYADCCRFVQMAGRNPRSVLFRQSIAPIDKGGGTRRSILQCDFGRSVIRMRANAILQLYPPSRLLPLRQTG